MVNITFMPYSYESELFITLQLTKERQKGGDRRGKGEEKSESLQAGLTATHLVVLGVGHVFCLHGAKLRRLAGKLNKEQQLLEDGWVHDLQVLRTHTDDLQQGESRDTMALTSTIQNHTTLLLL